MNTVEEYYNHQYDEWGRLERHRIEYEITRKVLDQYVDAGAKVLDVGGGPGRYSVYLAQKGNCVTLFDLSETLVNMAAENAKNAGVVLDGIIKGNVLELGRMIPDKTFDVVLCMGPLYHLTGERDREEAVRQCLMRLKPGGILIAAFISVYAPIVSCMVGNPNDIIEQKQHFLNYFHDGRNRTESGFTEAFFIKPEEIGALLEGFGLEKIRIMATEGLGFLQEQNLMKLEENAFQEWIDLLYQIADHNPVLGSCAHLLYIGRKG